MQATIDRLTVKDALTVMGRIVKGRSTIPVLETVHIDVSDNRLTLTVTNLSDTVSATVDATDTVPGTVLIDRKTLVGIVKTGPGKLDVSGTEDTVTVGPVSLPVTYPVSDFPTIPDAGRYVGYWTVSDRDNVETVSRFASSDEGRPVITGVYFNGTEAAATDSYRLSTGSVSSDALDGTLIPARAVSLVGKWKVSDPSVDNGVALHRAERLNRTDTVTFLASITNGPKRSPRTFRVRYTVETIEGTFPNYPALVPEPADVDMSALHVHVDRDGLLAALETVRPLAANGYNVPVSLSLVGSKLTLTVHVDNATATGTVIARAQGPGWSVPFVSEDQRLALTDGQGTSRFGIAFNPGFLRDALRALPAGPVSFTFRDALKPARIDHVDRDGTALLMPMRVS